MERDHAEHQSAGAQLLIVGPAGDQLTVLIQNVVLNEFGVFEVKIIRIVVWEQGWFVMVPDFNCKQVRWIQVLKSIETLTFGNFRNRYWGWSIDIFFGHIGFLERERLLLDMLFGVRRRNRPFFHLFIC